MSIGHCKEIRKLTFRALAHRSIILDSPCGRANAWNTSFRIPLQWPIHIINPVDKTKLFCNILVYSLTAILSVKISRKQQFMETRGTVHHVGSFNVAIVSFSLWRIGLSLLCFQAVVSSAADAASAQYFNSFSSGSLSTVSPLHPLKQN